MDPPCPRAEMERRICEAIQRGETLPALAGRPGFPSRRTVWRWSRESPAFAEALRHARDWRGGMLVARWQRPFDDARAAALVERVGQGERVKDLLRREGFPGRRALEHWRQLRPDFAEALDAAARAPRRPRRTGGRGYEEAAGDRIICRLSAGERMGEVLRQPGLPCARVLARWRQARPDFDQAVRTALLAGRRRRGAHAPPALAAEVCARVEAGATLDALAGADGLPHRATLHRWLARDPDFAARVRTAQCARDEPLADAALALAEQATPETLDAARRRLAEIKLALGRRGAKRRRQGPAG